MAVSEINHRGPVPPYRQIAADIIRDIEKGALAVDCPIPSGPKMVELYGVALATAQNAIKYLVEQGYVYTVPKRGTYVRDRTAQADGDGQGE
ncbi:GntR family transcriptional regulator [Streptomyces griseocarneus]|nr:GntR family transcriptional regulator [Streptomyces griseocarneus]